MMTSCVISASVCRAQEVGGQKSEVRAQQEVLANGDLILTIDGKSFLAMPPEKAKRLNDSLDELDRLRVALPLAQKEISQLRESLAAANERVKAADAKFSEQRLIAANWKSLYDADHVLLAQAVNLIKHGGRLDSFLNNPIVKLLGQIAVPAVNMALNARHR